MFLTRKIFIGFSLPKLIIEGGNNSSISQKSGEEQIPLGKVKGLRSNIFPIWKHRKTIKLHQEAPKHGISLAKLDL